MARDAARTRPVHLPAPHGVGPDRRRGGPGRLRRGRRRAVLHHDARASRSSAGSRSSPSAGRTPAPPSTPCATARRSRSAGSRRSRAATRATSRCRPRASRRSTASSGWCCPRPTGRPSPSPWPTSGAQVVGACLRNAGAVARWLAPRVADGASVVVVPAGERWHDDTLRPAVEDLWGAGAVLAALVDRGARPGPAPRRGWRSPPGRGGRLPRRPAPLRERARADRGRLRRRRRDRRAARRQRRSCRCWWASRSATPRPRRRPAPGCAASVTDRRRN